MNWADLRDFIRFLDAGSALVAEIDPDIAGWQGDTKTPMLLAHIADTLAGLSYSYTISHLKKGTKKPDPPTQIPRPGVRDSKQSEKHWGADAIPINAFNEWWERGSQE